MHTTSKREKRKKVIDLAEKIIFESIQILTHMCPKDSVICVFECYKPSPSNPGYKR